MTGEKVDCAVDAVVTAWFPDQTDRKWGNGFLRALDSGKRLYLRETNIISTGTVEVGTYVRCQIGPCETGYTTPVALSVEIYSIENAA
jgi:hypothetical protein